MAKLHYESDADLSLIRGERIAILGYGSQGHAHAQNLRDSGADVRVGLPEGSRSRARAEADGFQVMAPAEACAWARAIMVLTPDTGQAKLYDEAIAPGLAPGKTLMFAHGFNVRYGLIKAPEGVDVSMVAPKGPGHRVREVFAAGGGVPALFAVHQDASGRARAFALAYAKGLGATRAGVLETTFTEETETDLFGEKAVLCGGVSALVQAGFQTLVEAGYQPEIAYFECFHELKLIVDLMYRGGLTYMRHSISDTAEYGDYTGGPQVINAASREAMKRILREIQDGTYAAAWIQENREGRTWFEAQRAEGRASAIEQVGRELRRAMPFLEPVDLLAPDPAKV
ncbi:ketol-acid reductoisomerase [Mesoterricola sediminis]|uniref:Ketol-acid reductoisomerase (NADP(+)) n=1 Tax=Mesoterricola sediminis TaxID=2927980 RepID=A0AA48H6Z1_9BACT|nr:ketol-acid reductoisomerase [Mesoterricola sediminis]BDU78511.1 ketol-acid reductoisomerase (NADP(+)) [Mesoterricola sediminis]